LLRGWAVATLAVAACAGPGIQRRAGSLPAATRPETAVWQALGDGEDDAAEHLLAQARASGAGHAGTPGTGGGREDAALALADASLAFERGDVGRAIAAYLTVLDAAGTEQSSLAAMAAGRLATLLEEHPGPDADRRAVEDRILALSPDRWSWQARYAVASLWDRMARGRGDPALLSAIGVRAGCITGFAVARPLGRLPHLDLDIAAPPLAPLRAEVVRGCRSVVPSYQGRPGAQRLVVDVEAAAPGTFDVVLGFRGEARLIVDGGPAHPHGSEATYGPQLSATRVTWTAGRHRLELRLATYGGRPELTVMLVPVVEPGTGARERTTAGEPAASGAPPLAAALAAAYVANQAGELSTMQAAQARLEATPRFALGATLAAALVRDDPSLPSPFARDRARALLRRALAIDGRLARARNALAGLALDEDRPREALDEARLAVAAAPAWWLPRLTLHAAYEVRGLEWDADRALDEAQARGPRACAVIEAALGRADSRRDVAAVRRLTDDETVCGATDDDHIARLRRRGDWAEAERLLRLGLSIEPDPDTVRRDLSRLLVARGRAAEAVALLEPQLESGDGEATVAWADAAIAAGQQSRARARVAALLADRPDLPQLLRAARTLGLPLPLDRYRLDGRAVIAAFEQSGRRYAAPAVVVLDRTVTRVLDSGAALTLTHEIVRVQSKDAIEKWGEVSVPEGAEVLTLRTHKPDGTTREPEEVAGKDAISAADLAIGDYLEKETLEVEAPHDALAPAAPGRWGYLGDRFYFQSFDAPLDRSEYLLVTSPAMADALTLDSRAGAPAPARTGAPDGAVVTTFAAGQVPQLFAERASVPVIEHVPSVRLSAGATWSGWSRFLREQLYGTARDGAVLDRAVKQIRAQAAGTAPEALAAAAAAWVGQNVEPDDDLRGMATVAVASGRGNRVAAIQALARRLGLKTQLVLGRSRFVAEGAAVTPIQEADDFAEVLVRFDLPGAPPAYVDPRLKHAPFRYLSPGMDGGRVLELATASFQVAHTGVADGRDVDLTVRLADDGQATGQVVETVRGWPALEWAEVVDRFGADQTKLRQDFEQRWLGVHFPGAALKDLRVEILGSDGRQRAPQGASARGDDGGPPAGAEATPGGGASSRTVAQLPEDAADPSRPVTAAAVRLQYSFVSPRFAAVSGDRLHFVPTFFRALLGRRYATEPSRSTALMTGFEVPTTVAARIVLPGDARPERAALPAHAIERPGLYRFREQRRIEGGAGSATLELRRETRLPIQRIAPAAYPGVAADLRAADAVEGEEIVLRLRRRSSESRP